MRIKVDNSLNVKSNATEENVKFRVEASAAMFDILTNKLYSNVIGSIIREIISNAHDSHVVAHNESTPIKVHVPTEFEPYFEVRDFGVSLTPEQMVDVYTVFFKSSKNSSDEQIGGFGLGAKLPFAYTEQFTVTTFLNNIKTEYLCHKEDGVPVLQQMYSCEEESPDGLAVKVPVKPTDCNTFVGELNNFVQFPSFNLDIDSPDVFSGCLVNQKLTDLCRKFNKRVTIYESPENRNNSEVLIRLGGVTYNHSCNPALNCLGWVHNGIRVDLEDEYLKQLPVDFEDHKFYGSSLGKLRVVFDYAIGELQPTASRESLQMTEEQEKELVQEIVYMRSAIKCELAEQAKSLIEKMQNGSQTCGKKLVKLLQDYVDILKEYEITLKCLSDVKVLGSELFSTGVSLHESSLRLDSDSISNCKIIRTSTFGPSDFRKNLFVSFGKKAKVLVTKEKVSDVRNSDVSRSFPAGTSVFVIQLKKKTNTLSFINELENKEPLFFNALFDVEELTTVETYNEKRAKASKASAQTALGPVELDIIKQFGVLPVVTKRDSKDYSISTLIDALESIGATVTVAKTMGEYNKYLKMEGVKSVTDCKYLLKPYVKDAVVVTLYNAVTGDYDKRRLIEVFPEYVPEFFKTLSRKFKQISLNSRVNYRAIVNSACFVNTYGIKEKFDNSLSLEGRFLLSAFEGSYSLRDFCSRHQGETVSITL